jgi:copper chaperone
MTAVQLTVEGMTCGGCSSRLKRVLEGQMGIRTASVELETRQVAVDYDDADIDTNMIASVIADAGFSVANS